MICIYRHRQLRLCIFFLKHGREVGAAVRPVGRVIVRCKHPLLCRWLRARILDYSTLELLYRSRIVQQFFFFWFIVHWILISVFNTVLTTNHKSRSLRCTCNFKIKSNLYQKNYITTWLRVLLTFIMDAVATD